MASISGVSTSIPVCRGIERRLFSRDILHPRRTPITVMFALLLLASQVFAVTDRVITPASAPTYTAAGIVNSADGHASELAPNTIASLYGANLAYTTRAISGTDVQGGILPTVLPGTGVRILVSGIPAVIYYVSPGLINFLVPSILLPGPVDIQVAIDGLAGPDIQVQLNAAAPALFQLDIQDVVATRVDGSVVNADAPAQPGDWVILYATGLGQTSPPLAYQELATAPASLKQMSSFNVMLDGVAVDRSLIYYAGVSPGFAGLYQVNLKLPDTTGPNPEIRISLNQAISPAGLHLAVQP